MPVNKRKEKWKLNLMHHMVFMMAIQNVGSMFEETDQYPLANQAVKAGVINEEELDALLDKFTGNKSGTSMEMSFEEILLLYTIMDLNAKLMISHKGDQLREQMKIENNPSANPNVVAGFEGLLKMSSEIVRSLIKEYQTIPEFKQRMTELEKLNSFVY